MYSLQDTWHSFERRFKVHGYPPNFKVGRTKKVAPYSHSSDGGSSDGVYQCNIVSEAKSSSNNSTLTKEQCEQVLALLSKQNLEEAHSANLASSTKSTTMLSGEHSCFFSSKHRTHWILDTSATDHICHDSTLFDTLLSLDKPCHVTIPNGNQVEVLHTGSVTLTPHLTLEKVLYIPQLQFNLISISKLTKDFSSNLIFTPTSCFFQAPLTNTLVELGKEANGLFFSCHSSCTNDSGLKPSTFNIFANNVVDLSDTNSSCNVLSNNNSVCSIPISVQDLWHCRLGHLPYAQFRFIDDFASFKHSTTSISKIGLKARQHKSSFQQSTIKSTHSFQLLPIDIWAPYHQTTYNVYKYFLTIVDDFPELHGLISFHTKVMLSLFSNLLLLLLKNNLILMCKSLDRIIH